MVTALPAVARAQETRQIRPEGAQETRQIRHEVDLLKQSVSEKLQAAAERLGLSREQREKIKAAYSSFAATCTAQRGQREALRKEELKAMGDILTPEQREKARNYCADNLANP